MKRNLSIWFIADMSRVAFDTLNFSLSIDLLLFPLQKRKEWPIFFWIKWLHAKCLDLFNHHLSLALFVSFIIYFTMGNCMGKKIPKNTKLAVFKGFHNSLVCFEPRKKKWTFLKTFFETFQEFNIQHRRYSLIMDQALLVAGGLVHEDYNEGNLLDAESKGIDKNKMFVSKRVYLFDLLDSVNNNTFAKDKKNKSLGNLNIPRSDHLVHCTSHGSVIVGFGLSKNQENCFSIETIKYREVLKAICNVLEFDSEEEENEILYSKKADLDTIVHTCDMSTSLKKKNKKSDDSKFHWKLSFVPESIASFFPSCANPVALDLENPNYSVVFFFPSNLMRAIAQDLPCCFLVMEQTEPPKFRTFSATLSPETMSHSLTAFALAQDSETSFLLFGMATDTSSVGLSCFLVDMKTAEMKKTNSINVPINNMERLMECSFFTGQTSLPLLDSGDFISILISTHVTINYVRKTQKFKVDWNHKN